MDLRTKLVFALVGASLASMLALGAVAYRLASELLTEKALRQLDSLAEAKIGELEQVVRGWQDRVSLIASRTQLRLSLRAYNETGNGEQRDQIRRILRDARQSSEAVLRLVVYDVDGRPVAAVADQEDEGAIPALGPDQNPQMGEAISIPHISFTNEGEARANFVAPLVLEGRRVGALHVVLHASALLEVTQDTAGLGQTGETMVVLMESAGLGRVLHPLRHGASDSPAVIRPEGPEDPAIWALQGRDTVIAEGLIDYRGEPVWAATRYLPEVGWGVVVKFDADEEREPIRELRNRLTQLGLSLSAFAILLGTLLGLRFAKPIRDLAGVANRIRLGHLDARSQMEREDELGLLARTFDQMADELERRMTLLHEFRKFFDVSLDMLCIAGTDGYFKRVNPTFERVLGWSKEELLSRPFVEFVHPDDVDATFREIERLAEGIPSVSFRNRYRCADGSWKLLLWRAHPEPEKGLIYAIARDVGELTQTEGPTPGPGSPEDTGRE